LEKLSVTHSCGDSALKCVDCSEQVCPKCFVQCAVGNRCKKCAGRFTSHVLKAPPAVLIRLGLVMAAVGFGYGYLAPRLLSTPLGIYGYIVEFFIFLALGKFLHRAASYKMGAKVLGTAILGLIIGLVISPFRDVLMSLGSSAQAGAAGGGNDDASTYLVNLAIMLVGVLAPYFRKS
jgi:hypothetical protein